MRIIIFTDSLGRPRPNIRDNEKTCYEDVYGFQLKKYFVNRHDVELLYVESLDTEDAIHWPERMVAFRAPDVVVFHLGINDCAPRIFRKKGKSILFLPFIRKLTSDVVLKALSYFRYSITRIKPTVYVSKDDFLSNFQKMMDDILKYNKNAQFIAIGIAESNTHDKKSFGYNRNVSDYNQILKSLFDDNSIDPNGTISEFGLISDNVHLTKESHNKIFGLLKEKIESL